MSLLRSWRFWLGFAVSLLCLWFALRRVPLGELARLLADTNPRWLLTAVIMQLLAVITRARRWVVILGKKARLADCFRALSIGYLFTNVFPLMLGEPARVIVMTERSQLPVMQVAASALVERMLDVMTIVLALLLTLPWMKVPALVSRAGVLFGGIALAAFTLSLLAVRFSSHSEWLVRWFCQRLPILPAEGVIARWRELVNGLSLLTRRDLVARVAGWSLVTWAFSIATFWCVLRSFRPDSTVVEAAFMLVALSLAITVPSSPGFVGVFQLVGQQALVLPFGSKYDSASALAITMTVHLVYYLLTTTLGVIGLWRLGESFARLGRVVRGGHSASLATPREVTSST